MQRKTQYYGSCSIFERLAHLAAVCFAGFTVLLLNLPEVGHSAAIMVKGRITTDGNGATVDSYNSSDPTKSTDGQYDASKAGNCGDVICVGGVSNVVSVGNVNIYGRVFSGVTNVFLGTNGAVGTHAWQNDGNIGFELGYLVQNTNLPFTNITLPDYSGFSGPPIPGGTVVVPNPRYNPASNYYDHVLCGNYYSTNWPSGDSVVTCPSVMVLTAGFTNSGTITIDTNASLTIYTTGTRCLMSGNNFVNIGGFPSNFVLYCTSDVTNLSISGNAPLTAVLFAPNADVAVNGGGNNNTDFFGALMANSLSLHGHWNFHFDQALLQQGLVPPSPSIAANLTSPAMSGAGQFQFNVTGVVGSNSVVETTTDLTDWSPVFTNSLPFTFTDTNSSGPSQNFYRVVYTQ